MNEKNPVSEDNRGLSVCSVMLKINIILEKLQILISLRTKKSALVLLICGDTF